MPIIFHTGSLELGYQIILDSGDALELIGELDGETYHLYMILFFRCVFCTRTSSYNYPVVLYIVVVNSDDDVMYKII